MGASDRIIAAIESGALARFVARQRWFAGRSRGLESVVAIDDAAIVDHDRAGLAIVEVRHLDGSVDPYFLPWIAVENDAETDADSWTIAPGLRDGLSDRSISLALLDRVGRLDPIPTRSGGQIVGVPTRSFERVRGDAGPTPEPSYGWIEQSHSAVRFDRALFLKVFRRLEPGISPDFEVGRFLHERADFQHTPAVAGGLEYRPIGQPAMTAALLQPWIESRGTAWDCSQRDLDQLFAMDDTCVEAAVRTGESLATTLGQRTGELHRALASRPDDPDFAPRPIEESDAIGLIDEAQAQLRRTMAALRDVAPSLPEPTRSEAAALLDRESQLSARLGRIPEARGLAIRIHGDYHLGQVLRTEDDDFQILDLEGEPGQPLDRRRGRHPALRDVVGMLRSFDYAAHAALFRHPDEFDRHANRAFAWRDRSSTAFLRGYRAATRGEDLVPADAESWVGLLVPHKALYELLYEINHRPTWARVPLRGLLALAEPRGRLLPD